MASGFQRLYTVDDAGKLVLAQEVSIADGKLLFFWHAPHHHYHFPIAETHEVRQVGMSAGELFGRERACAGGEMVQQEFLERS